MFCLRYETKFKGRLHKREGSINFANNEVRKGVFQRYKLARRDGLHWSFARCVQIPDEAGLARWERMRAQQIERMQARAEKAAAEAAGKA